MRSDYEEQDCRRSEPRSAVECTALAFRSDGRRSVISVADLSLSGVQIAGGSFADGDEFRLVIPQRGDINARVEWASANMAGARFDENLVLDGVMPARDNYAVRRLRSYNFSSGRTFGRRGTPAS